MQVTQQEELTWVKPSWRKREFELRDGEQVIAREAWGRGYRATADWATLRLRLDTHGWLKRHTVIMRDDGAPAGDYAHRQGTLTLADGQVFRWQRPEKRSRDRVWLDAAGNRLVRLHPARGGTTVRPEQSATPPELPLLIVVGHYLLALAQQDEEAATVGAIVAVMGGAS
ncbi:MAG TPA: hypothetical protein VF807_07560 [Ktedonobacterales bacterium]